MLCEKCGNHLAFYRNAPESPALCEDCWEKYSFECECCGQVVHPAEDGFEETVDGQYICGHCATYHFTRCDRCGGFVKEPEVYWLNGTPYCEDCYESTVEELKQGEDAPIKEYCYKPTPIVHATKEQGTRSNFATFGVELETECDDKDGDYLEECAVNACSLVKGENDTKYLFNNLVPIKDDSVEFFYAKEDGSLNNGIEFVSHPMTLSWMYENTTSITKFLDTLIDWGFTGFRTETAGLHIHVGGESIINNFAPPCQHGRTEGLAWLKRVLFYQLAFYQVFTFKKITRRDPDDSDYALFPFGVVRWSNRTLQYQAIKSNQLAMMESLSENRRNCINVENLNIVDDKLLSGTVEYRSFKSTLRPLGFFSSVEFLHLFIRLAAKYVNEKVQIGEALVLFPEDFFVLANQYKFLPEYIADRNYCIAEMTCHAEENFIGRVLNVPTVACV